MYVLKWRVQVCNLLAYSPDDSGILPTKEADTTDSGNMACLNAPAFSLPRPHPQPLSFGEGSSFTQNQKSALNQRLRSIRVIRVQKICAYPSNLCHQRSKNLIRQ